MSSELIVVATLTALPGKEAEVEALCRGAIAPTHAEDGCIVYALHRDQKDPARFTYIERWASRAHLDAHLASPHLHAFRAKMADVSAGPAEILLLDALADGDPTKGAL
jgi:quinol monooxygenase YgiN